MASIPQHSEDTQANRLIKFGMALGVRGAIHPFEYAKVLIQVRVVCLCVLERISICFIARFSVLLNFISDWL